MMVVKVFRKTSSLTVRGWKDMESITVSDVDQTTNQIFSAAKSPYQCHCEETAGFPAPADDPAWRERW